MFILQHTDTKNPKLNPGTNFFHGFEATLGHPVWCSKLENACRYNDFDLADFARSKIESVGFKGVEIVNIQNYQRSI